MDCEQMSTYIQNFFENSNSIKNPKELSDVVQNFYRNCTAAQTQPITRLVIQTIQNIKNIIIKKTRIIILGNNSITEGIKLYKNYKSLVTRYKFLINIFSIYGELTAFNINEFDNNLRLFDIAKKANIPETKILLVNPIVISYLHDININEKELETNLTNIKTINNTNLENYKTYFKYIHSTLEKNLLNFCPKYNLRSVQNPDRMLDSDCILLHLFKSEIEKIARSLKTTNIVSKKASLNVSQNALVESKMFFKQINNLELNNFYNKWMTLSNMPGIHPDAPYDVYLYLTNGFDNFIDLFVSLVSESNRDLLMLDIHTLNIESIYSTFEQAILDIALVNPVTQGVNPGARGVNPVAQGTIRMTQAQPQQAQQQFVYNSSSSSGSGPIGGKKRRQKGGAPNDFCLGRIDESVIPLEKQAYYTLCLSKTRDELKHDFNFNKETMNRLLKIYDSTIDTFVKGLIDNTQTSETPKIINFIDLLKSYSVGSDSEWNYYTSVLQTMDKECNKLEELTMTKVASLDKYPYLNTVSARDNGYIVNLKGKDYLYMAIDTNPVVPLFDFKDVCTSVKDNATADFKLYPLLYETVNETDLNNFADSLIDFYYAPGMIDPKTTGPYPKTNFTANPNIGKIKLFPTTIPDLDTYKRILNEIQLSQDINNETEGANNSRIDMMNGINSFMRYFGANFGLATGPIVDSNTVRFIEIQDGTKYSGIQFVIPSVTNPIQIQIGDTTIDNVTNFVNRFDGIIPLGQGQIQEESWKRLHNFGTVILSLIPPAILTTILNNIDTSFNNPQIDQSTQRSYLLTEIIITLKSFGDSFQVYYSKKLRDRIKITYDLDLYLSSTDKNVGGECLLLNNTFWLIGTGIRPHSDFFTKNKGFFGKESFKQKAAGLGVIEKETDIDGTVAITTNKSLMNESKYVESINNTFLKIYPNLTNVPINPENVPLIDDPRYDAGNIFSSISLIISMTNNEFLSEAGIAKFNNMIGLIKTDPSNIKNNLKELDAFLKKIYDVIKLTEVIPTAEAVVTSVDAVAVATSGPMDQAEADSIMVAPVTKETLLFQKLDTLTSFINMKFCLSLRAIKKSNILKESAKLEAVIATATATKIENIFSKELYDFSKQNLNEKYTDIFVKAHNKYDAVMAIAKEDIIKTLRVLNSENTVGAPPQRQQRQAAINAKEEAIKRAIDDEIIAKQLTGRTSAKTNALQEKLDIAKTKLNDLINSYGPKILNGADQKKLAAAKKLVETSLTKYETKQKNDSNENAAAATAKIKSNIEKNDPVKVCNMISGLLTSMKTKLDEIHLFRGSHGGKKTHTRKHNKFKKNKTIRKRLMSSKRTIKNKHRKKMTRIYRKSNN